MQIESRPACEGRDNAEKLLAGGARVTVIPDAAMGHWLEQADAVLAGADAIQNNGDFLGKIGRLPLVRLARIQRIPFYVAGESLKIVSELPSLA